VEKPVTVMVGVILLAMFGGLAVTLLPIQLTPDVDQPLITVTTLWEGASPQEVEREVIEEQEEQLKAVPNLKRMVSRAVRGSATVELEFRVGTDITRALLDTSDRLRQVPSYPEGVDQPVVTAGETEGTNAIAWFILQRLPRAAVTAEDLPLMRTLLEEEVQPFLERTPGVAGIGVVGGHEREIHVEIDTGRLAGHGLTLLDVRNAIRERNVDISAGDMDGGKAAFTVRTVGRFERLEELENCLLARRDNAAVHLRDVARITEGYKEADTVVRALGRPSIAVNATRESGSNVITVMAELKASLARVNDSILRPKGLELIQVYDQTVYIFSAIDLVFQNLWVGGTLAVIVLLLFLRSPSSTLITALAIPICVVGSFLALVFLGRNLNVVSLAGLAFSVGMVVDNAIVVLENIYRHRQMGEGLFEAATNGAREVWGAVLASTLTTMAVFIPVVFVEEEAGQLFRDIAIAISASVFISLLVAVFFIPMAAARALRRVKESDPNAPGFLGIDWLGRKFADGITALVALMNRNVITRVSTVVVITFAAVFLTIAFVPPMSYLPQGNQNLILGFVITPPGYSNDELTRIAESVEERLAPYWAVRDGHVLTEEEEWPAWYEGKKPLPGINNFFYVATGRGVFMGAQSSDPLNVAPLADLFTHAAADVPGVFVFATQRSLFERGITAGNSIEIEITGPSMDEISAAAGAVFGSVMHRMGPPRPEPSNYDLGAPEVLVKVDDVRAADLGLSVADLGFMVQTLIDGAIVSDFRQGGITLDVKLLSDERDIRRSGNLEQVPIYTPAGRQVPLSSVATLENSTAATEIRHIEERRAITLIATPAPGTELSTAMDMVEDEILGPLRASGAIGSGVSVELAGTADKLQVTREALKWNFVLAAIITYLLLSALFESFLYPVIILFTVPLAGVGGILALRVIHEFTGQEMDVLTMLGFVILIGTVVNNAILIVHQALNEIRVGGLSLDDAIQASVRTRIRPIFMSTLTSVLGMAPLVFFPGAGSELYRGLGSVVLGGLLASTVFTLFVTPTLFRLLGGIGVRPAVSGPLK
jgi:HAE1 family hydrophobic/amphiphilic exporter-1